LVDVVPVVLLVLIAAGLLTSGALIWLARSRPQRRPEAVSVPDAPVNQVIRSRADQQNQWAIAGDSRGVFGEEGAELMHSLTEDDREPLGQTAPIAQIARTSDELAALFEERPPMWAHTAFISVLMQRRSAVTARLKEVSLGPADPTITWNKNLPAAILLAAGIGEFISLREQLADLVISTPVQQMFDADRRDPDFIVLAANRIMDYHDKFLELAENTRKHRVRRETYPLQKLVWQSDVETLDRFGDFIAAYLRRLGQGEEALRYGSGRVELGQVNLPGGLSSEDKQALIRCQDAARELVFRGL